MPDTTPAQREAENTATVEVDWDGVPVTLPGSPDDMDLDVLEAFEGGKAVAALRGLVGDRGYDELRNAYAKKNGHKPKVGDLGRLMENIAAAYGFETQGN